MARLPKEGLDYFPLDCAMDEKLELIEAEFGLTGFAVVVKLWQRIYAKGYYCEWNDEVALLFANSIGLGGGVVSSFGIGIGNGVSSLSAGGDGVPKKVGVVPLSAGGGIVPEIVRASIRRGIFDAEIFEQYHVLTSSGIQKRYLDAARRRKVLTLTNQYLLVDVAAILDNVNIKVIYVDINSENVCNNPQRRVKESRGEKSKGYKTLAQKRNEMFEDFWAAYPKKKSKASAEKAWNKIKMSEEMFEKIMNAIAQAKGCAQWTKDGGQFIPYPATWLNAGGWEDEYDRGTHAVHGNIFAQIAKEEGLY